MPASTTPTQPSPSGIVAYVAVGRKPHDQRERIQAALAAHGMRVDEIVEEDVTEAATRGRYGVGRLRELAGRSTVRMFVVTSEDVLGNPMLVDSLRHEFTKYGQRLLALE